MPPSRKIPKPTQKPVKKVAPPPEPVVEEKKEVTIQEKVEEIGTSETCETTIVQENTTPEDVVFPEANSTTDQTVFEEISNLDQVLETSSSQLEEDVVSVDDRKFKDEENAIYYMTNDMEIFKAEEPTLAMNQPDAFYLYDTRKEAENSGMLLMIVVNKETNLIIRKEGVDVPEKKFIEYEGKFYLLEEFSTYILNNFENVFKNCFDLYLVYTSKRYQVCPEDDTNLTYDLLECECYDFDNLFALGAITPAQYNQGVEDMCSYLSLWKVDFEESEYKCRNKDIVIKTKNGNEPPVSSKGIQFSIGQWKVDIGSHGISVSTTNQNVNAALAAIDSVNTALQNPPAPTQVPETPSPKPAEEQTPPPVQKEEVKVEEVKPPQEKPKRSEVIRATRSPGKK